MKQTKYYFLILILLSGCEADNQHKKCLIQHSQVINFVEEPLLDNVMKVYPREVNVCDKIDNILPEQKK